ncbi:hypothetical protein NDU88_006112 [Pleurodeles waltl]|uniref:Uncharacterized protein n=1 Tax=Pleurodeles waltl TaxID=8319 RepID=A0AAV7NPU0_PLEWA|nr:hypothetical protein NDU88_006112 [Pleurodeles waltl]
MIRAAAGSSQRYSAHQPTHHQLRQPRAPRRTQLAWKHQARRPLQPMRQSRSKVGPPGQPLAPHSQLPHWLGSSAPVTKEEQLPTANFVAGNKSATQSLPMSIRPAPHQISKPGWAHLLEHPGRRCAAARAAQPTIALVPSSYRPPPGHWAPTPGL